MENKNILFVIASVSLFLVIVIGAGLWLFWPKGDTRESAESAAVRPLFDKDFDSFEFYKSREEIPGLLEEEEAAQPETAEGEKPEEADGDEITLAIGESEDRVSIERKEREAVREKPEDASRKEPEPERPSERTQAASKPEPAAAPASSARTSRAPRRVYVKEYEIQVGSFGTKERADSVADQLKRLGLAGNIRTKVIDGRTYFRVRIGPYSQQGEAAKFLAWLRDVKGMEDSYISQVTRTKIIN